jgi:hypothetical protein
MRFWSREIAGWLFAGLGLYTFYLCYELLMRAHVVEAGALTVIGVFLFRGGIHLLKVAVAAEVCLDARVRPSEARTPLMRQPPATRLPSRVHPGRPAS